MMRRGEGCMGTMGGVGGGGGYRRRGGYGE